MPVAPITLKVKSSCAFIIKSLWCSSAVHVHGNQESQSKTLTQTTPLSLPPGAILVSDRKANPSCLRFPIQGPAEPNLISLIFLCCFSIIILFICAVILLLLSFQLWVSIVLIFLSSSLNCKVRLLIGDFSCF